MVVAKPTVRRVVRKGNKGAAVKKLQRALNTKYEDKHPVDGIFGQKTKNRLKRWQKKRGLTPDGVAGRSTWRSLGYNLKLPPGKVTLASGAKPAGDELMRRLRKAAVYLGKEIRVISGDRTAYQAWILRMRYLNGTGNLAARCCSQYGKHSWNACGKRPTSNHARGKAVDCGVIINGKYVSFMLAPGTHAAAKHARLKAPMWPPWGRRIEPWHLELA